MMKVDVLKTVAPFFWDVWHGHKTFEVRRNDRDFQEGQQVFLIHWDAGADRRLDLRAIRADVTYVLKGGQFGIQEGYCVLGLDRIINIPSMEFTEETT
jgi:hypothetical protein